MATDPLAVGAAFPVWDGAWPPDPSWDEPFVPPAPPELPADWNQSPVPDVAFDAGPAPAATMPPSADGPAVTIGRPRPVAETTLAPEGPDDIQLEPELAAAPPAADWSGLAQSATDVDAEPWDADLIEQEEPEAAPPTDDERVAGLLALEQQAPGTIAMAQAKQQLAAEEEAATKRITAARADRERAEESERVYREAVTRTRAKADAIAAEADRLAAEKVDPDGWKNSRSLFQTIASISLGIVGGLVQSRQGGPNQGLAMINQAIERHIAAQRENLAHRRELLSRKQTAIGVEQDRVDQDFRVEEAFRQAAYTRALEDIETERQQYNPAGTRALKLAEVSRGIQAQLAASREALVEKTLKREMEVGRYKMEVEKHELAKRKAAAASAGAAAAKTPRPAAYFAALGLPPPPMPMTEKQYDTWLNRQGETSRIANSQAQRTATEQQEARAAAKESRAVAQEERELAIGAGTQLTGAKKDAQGRLLNADGSLFKARTPESGRALEKQIASTVTAANIIDELLRLRNTHGWSSDLLKSDEWRAMQANKGALIIELKNAAELGALAGPDVEVINSMLGTSDPTELRDPAEGLKKARENAILRTKRTLETSNYTGDFDVVDKSKPLKAARDKDLEALVSRGKGGTLVDTAGAMRLKEGGGLGVDPHESERLSSGLTKSQQLGLDALVTRARGGEPQAAANLVEAVKNAPNTKARDAAVDALLELARAGNEVAAKAIREHLAGFPIVDQAEE